MERKENQMSTQENATVLIVPGLRDHVPGHWQTLLEAKLSKVRSVPPLENDKLNCTARVEAIQRAIEQIEGPIIVVAHSGGVIMMLHWAQKYQHPIKGALFATPPDFETPLPAGYPTLETLRVNGWLPIPRTPLPFPSIVAASENDPLANLERVVDMARDWNSELVNLGKVEHLNPASGYGEWPQAEEFIGRLRTCSDSCARR